MLIIEELEDVYDVFDITVSDNHNFYANGVLVHNCEIMLPTEPFQYIEDAGSLTIEYQGKDVVIPNMATARLVNGTTKLVRHVTESDDIAAFIFEDGHELVLRES